MKKLFLVGIILLILIVTGCQRVVQKNMADEVRIPALRTITLYAENGKLIGQWHGTYAVGVVGSAVFITDEQGKTMIISGTLLIQDTRD